MFKRLVYEIDQLASAIKLSYEKYLKRNLLIGMHKILSSIVALLCRSAFPYDLKSFRCLMDTLNNCYIDF